MYNVETLKRRKRVLREAILGDRCLFVKVETLEEMRELAQLVPAGKVTVVLGKNFYKYAPSMPAEFLLLLSKYPTSMDVSCRNKTALWDLLNRVSVKLQPREGILRNLWEVKGG